MRRRSMSDNGRADTYHSHSILTTWGSKPEPPKIPSADQRGLSRARSMGWTQQSCH